MIQFQITLSPDSDVLGIEQIDKNSVTIGIKDCDILINDEDIGELIIELKISEENILTATPLTEEKKFWVNNKVYSFEKKINPMDIIKVGSTEIKIISFAQTVSPDFDKISVSRLEELYSQNSPVIELLNQFEQQLRDKNE